MPDPDNLILSISELNRLARLAIEKNLPSCWVKGELSNLTRASSGHWYFSIKDATASARCVMFRGRNQFVNWPLREGEQVELRAQASLYEARGDYQLIVDAMRKAGRGDLFEALMRLKEKLQKEGLFDPERKRPIPVMPRCLGVITSPQGAAVMDVLTTLRLRWPLARVVLYPCPVQGEGAPPRIIQALGEANQRAEAEVLLLVRGGGSLEDLWAFNDEALTREIAASRIPVISGVGHETDFSLADFAADLRAPTPTGAAQMAVPDKRETLQGILSGQGRLSRSLRARLESAWQGHDHLRRRLRHPKDQILGQYRQLKHLRQRLMLSAPRALSKGEHRVRDLRHRLQACRPRPDEALRHASDLLAGIRQGMRHRLSFERTRLSHLATQLQLLCPSQVIKRGYSIARDANGHIITSSDQVSLGQAIEIELSRGRIGAEVTWK